MQGSCNCNSVHFSASADIRAIVNCHCNLCRKMNGGAFSTYVVVADEGFVLTKGCLKTVQVSENATKSFCESCGTPIFNQNPKLAGLKILYFGSIDTPSNLEPAINIYCESQLSWVTQVASLPNFAQGVE
ncbi:GFA family protein [Lacimicrobium alkaliphilum]|uniref:Aldehyde-activating protein n=1 Tax=Lacimicrobium alkaliphilum TaxID=1526571 RepID=A0A0U2Z1W2_9ALTE|nr:GFA family protein [Lacimicrobium alkaliphilum]ALS96883.1 aldehyde-activating protein [Lacimicrobium alkaliphilum]